LAPEWTWSVKWPERFSAGGRAYSRQEGADRATAAWWQEVRAAEEREQREAPIARFMAHLIATGEYDLGQLDIRSMAYADLMTIMDEVTRRQRGNTVYPRTEFVDQFARLAAELSAEFYRRRQQDLSE
jgi:hypothetical protein